jgi:hypothetical protein
MALIERGMLVDHFFPQKYSIVGLAYENQRNEVADPHKPSNTPQISQRSKLSESLEKVVNFGKTSLLDERFCVLSLKKFVSAERTIARTF